MVSAMQLADRLPALLALPLAAEKTFWEDHGDEISAAITIAVTFLVAFLVDRFVIGRGMAAAQRLGESGVSRTAHTRLRLVRRLVFVVILVIGIALALSQFDQIKRLATGILASSAVLGLVVGLAARQSLGNMVAGILVAIAQPIRIGDRVTFEDTTGRVADITLTYTYLDPGDGRMVVIPNESIVSGTVFNHSTGDRAAPITVNAWVPATADVGRAEDALKGAGADSVRVAEWTIEGVRLEVKLAADRDRTRVGDEEEALRQSALAALQRAGVLAEPAG
jgi:small-conductance mechanosensitive channel